MLSDAEIATQLIGSHIDFAVIVSTAALPHISVGKMRLLASTGEVRWPELPEIPALIEMGIDASLESSAGFIAPKGTPPAVLAKLEAAVLQATREIALDPESKRIASAVGVLPYGVPGKDYKADLMKQAAFMREVLGDKARKE